MSFRLHVDGARWRAHLRHHAAAHPGIVPVVKGNGYGLGRDVLAREAAGLGVDMIAVGTYAEVPGALQGFAGDVLVLTPWRPFLDDVVLDPRVVHTVGRVEDVAALAATAPAGTRVVVEGETSMSRHGLDRHEIAAAVAALGELQVEGFALHLPLGRGHLAEAESWVAALETSRLDTSTVFVSHLDPAEHAELASRRPQLTIRPRVGTSLWLGDPGALSVRAHVLDVHQVERGERVGYRQRPVPRGGYLLVVAGGTSHGIGLEAPKAVAGVVQRGKSVARGGLEAAGLALSPFVVAGRQRWFAEPPHMHVSLVLLPESVTPPAVGDEVTASVRFTTASFDAVVID